MGGGVSCQSFLVVGFIIKMTINAVGTQESHTKLGQALPSSNTKEAVKRTWGRERRKCLPRYRTHQCSMMGQEVDGCSQDTAATLWNAVMWEAALQLKVVPLWVMALAKGSADKEGGITWSYLVQKWDSNSRAADLGYRVNLPCPLLEWWSWCFSLYPLSFSVFLVLWLWILWFLATWSSWCMAVRSGTVFTCKSGSHNSQTKNTVQICWNILTFF